GGALRRALVRSDDARARRRAASRTAARRGARAGRAHRLLDRRHLHAERPRVPGRAPRAPAGQAVSTGRTGSPDRTLVAMNERPPPEVIEPRARDVEGTPVGRVLPVIGRRSVGPFVFFDHMGPAQLAPGRGMDVRPHPHIGLATVTYLFEGSFLHRDSLGS